MVFMTIWTQKRSVFHSSFQSVEIPPWLRASCPLRPRKPTTHHPHNWKSLPSTATTRLGRPYRFITVNSSKPNTANSSSPNSSEKVPTHLNSSSTNYSTTARRPPRPLDSTWSKILLTSILPTTSPTPAKWTTLLASSTSCPVLPHPTDPVWNAQ